MISKRKRRMLAVLAFIICIIGGILSARSLVGREARLVDTLQLFFSGMGGGASFVAAVGRGRKNLKV